MDDATGQAFVDTGFDEDKCFWASDHMHLSVTVKDDTTNPKFLENPRTVSIDGPVGALHDIVSECSTKVLTLVPAGSGADQLTVSVALFSNSDASGRLWIDVIDLWDSLHLKFHPGTGSKWFHKKKTSWHNLITSCGFGNTSITRANRIGNIYSFSFLVYYCICMM